MYDTLVPTSLKYYVIVASSNTKAEYKITEQTHTCTSVNV